MTYLLQDIRDHLEGSPAIQDLVAGRIYPDVVPQGTTYPYINLSDLSNSPEESLDGEIGTHESMITIDAWTDGAGGRGEAQTLSELIRSRMSGYKGQFGTGVWCNGAHVLRNQILASDPYPGSDQHRRRASQDYRIIHTADVPTFA